MTRRRRLPMKAIAAVFAIAAALGGDAKTTFAAGGPTRSTDSLTTQFPLGDEKLARPGPSATSPKRSTSTSVTSTASAPSPRTTTSSRDPLLGGSAGDSTGAVIVLGVVIVGGLALTLVARRSVRRRNASRQGAAAAALVGPAPRARPRSAPAPRGREPVKPSSDRAPGTVVDDPAPGARPDRAAAETSVESRLQGIEALRRAGTPSAPPRWQWTGKGKRRTSSQ